MIGRGTPNSHRHPDRMVTPLDLAVVTRNRITALPLGNRGKPALFPVTGFAQKGGDMSSTAVLTEDTATIVAEDVNHFRWGVAIAGAIAATATTLFLLTLGAGVGLALVKAPHAATATAFFNLGAIYFLASQAFGFAVGGYLVGRLIGPEVENTAEEEFRAGAHGFVMWALAVVAGLLLIAVSSGVTGSAVMSAIATRADDAANSRYWADAMFGPGPNSPQMMADKAEAGRILAMNGAAQVNDQDTERLARMVSIDENISMPAAMTRVSDAEARMAHAANDARKSAAIAALWTAFSLLFGAVVAVAASIAARWEDDRINFSLKPRR